MEPVMTLETEPNSRWRKCTPLTTPVVSMRPMVSMRGGLQPQWCQWEEAYNPSGVNETSGVNERRLTTPVVSMRPVVSGRGGQEEVGNLHCMSCLKCTSTVTVVPQVGYIDSCAGGLFKHFRPPFFLIVLTAFLRAPWTGHFLCLLVLVLLILIVFALP